MPKREPTRITGSRSRSRRRAPRKAAPVSPAPVPEQRPALAIVRPITSARTAKPAPAKAEDGRIMWGWLKVTPEHMADLAPGAEVDFSDRRIAQGVHWVPGDLATSYDRVARHGGAWVLVSSMPSHHYRDVVAMVAAERATEGK